MESKWWGKSVKLPTFCWNASFFRLCIPEFILFLGAFRGSRGFCFLLVLHPFSRGGNHCIRVVTYESGRVATIAGWVYPPLPVTTEIIQLNQLTVSTFNKILGKNIEKNPNIFESRMQTAKKGSEVFFFNCFYFCGSSHQVEAALKQLCVVDFYCLTFFREVPPLLLASGMGTSTKLYQSCRCGYTFLIGMNFHQDGNWRKLTSIPSKRMEHLNFFLPNQRNLQKNGPPHHPHPTFPLFFLVS